MAYTVIDNSNKILGTKTWWIKDNTVLPELAIKMVLDVAILKGVMLF